MRTVGSDRRIVDADGAGGLETDASIERRLAEQHEEWPSARLGRGHERVHERGADASPLVRRRDADRRHAGDRAGRAVDAAGRSQRVRDHRAGLVGHQLDERRGRAGGPRAADDGELFGGVPGVVGEGRVDQSEDLLLVSRSLRGAYEHAHGSRTPTPTM